MEFVKFIFFSQFHIPLILVFWASSVNATDSYALALSAWLVYLLDPLLPLTSSPEDVRYKPIRTEFVNQHKKFYYALSLAVFCVLLFFLERLFHFFEKNTWLLILSGIYYLLRKIKALKSSSLLWKPMVLTTVWTLALQSLIMEEQYILWVYIYLNTLCFEIRDGEYLYAKEIYFGILTISLTISGLFLLSSMFLLFGCLAYFAWRALWSKPKEWHYVPLLDYPLCFFPILITELPIL